MTAGAELGSRCSVTTATSGRRQMKEGFRFQGLRPEGDFDLIFPPTPALWLWKCWGAKEGIKEGLAQFSFLTSVVLLVKREKCFFKKKIALDRKDPGSYGLMSCLASRRSDNPAPSCTGNASHNLPPLPLASQLPLLGKGQQSCRTSRPQRGCTGLLPPHSALTAPLKRRSPLAVGAGAQGPLAGLTLTRASSANTKPSHRSTADLRCELLFFSRKAPITLRIVRLYRSLCFTSKALIFQMYTMKIVLYFNPSLAFALQYMVNPKKPQHSLVSQTRPRNPHFVLGAHPQPFWASAARRQKKQTFIFPLGL